MLIREFQDTDAIKLAGIGQFLLRRAEDTAAQKKISVDAFVSLANQNGINLTPERLRQMAQQPPLSNIIANVTDDEVIFTGGDESPTADQMSVDQARKKVDQMAKRALSRS